MCLLSDFQPGPCEHNLPNHLSPNLFTQASADPCGTARNDITQAGVTSYTITTFATQQYQGKDFCSWSSSPLDPEETQYQSGMNSFPWVYGDAIFFLKH